MTFIPLVFRIRAQHWCEVREIWRGRSVVQKFIACEDSILKYSCFNDSCLAISHRRIRGVVTKASRFWSMIAIVRHLRGERECVNACIVPVEFIVSLPGQGKQFYPDKRSQIVTSRKKLVKTLFPRPSFMCHDLLWDYSESRLPLFSCPVMIIKSKLSQFDFRARWVQWGWSA